MLLSCTFHVICILFNFPVCLVFTHAAVFSFTVDLNENTFSVITYIKLPFRVWQHQYNVSFELFHSLHFALSRFSVVHFYTILVSLYFLLFLSSNLFLFGHLESVAVCGQGRIHPLAATNTTGKYSLNLEKGHYTIKLIPKLVLEDATEITD